MTDVTGATIGDYDYLHYFYSRVFLMVRLFFEDLDAHFVTICAMDQEAFNSWGPDSER